MKTILKVVGLVALIAVLIPALFYISLNIWGDWHDSWSGYNASTYIGDGYCNIAVLPIQGEIVGYGGVFDEMGNQNSTVNVIDSLSFLDKAEYEPGILGVMAMVDSTGGSAATGELVASALQKSKLPNLAYIANSGTSAAYLIATGADSIMASPFSDVGSIGVTMSYLDYSKQNESMGIDYVSLSSGIYKDYGSPDKPMTDDERLLLERDLDVWHQEFVKQVANNRQMSVEEVSALADGSSLPGSMALEAGLVDSLGNLEDARTWFAGQLGLPDEEVIFCGYN
jgi:protease-4